MSASDPNSGATSDPPTLSVEPRRVLEGLPAEVFTLDAQGRIVDHPSGTAAQPGRSEHLIGRTMGEWCRGRGYPEAIGERRQAAVERCIETRLPVSFEEIWHSPLGGTRHSIHSYAPVLGPDGTAEAVVAASLAVPQGGRARRAGSVGSSPATSDAEVAALRSALAQAERIRDSLEERCREGLRARSRDLPDEFVLGLPGLAEVRTRVESLASWTGPILVTGEAGSGASVVARALHDRKGRGKGLSLELDCLDQPREVDEALGHVTQRLLVREEAAGRASGDPVWYSGLTLHGPGVLSDGAQRTLMGAIEALAAAERRGSGSEPSIRLVLTTEADLLSRAAAGLFDSGLAETLTKTRIDVPPLRHRSEDLPLLAGRLLERASRRLGRPVEPLTSSDLTQLAAYLWPGNVPELKTVVERAILTARDGRPTIALPDGGAAREAASRGALGVPVYTESEMRQRERDNLLEALRRTSWKIYGPGGAAELLGLAPTTLASRIKKLRLARP